MVHGPPARRKSQQQHEQTCEMDLERQPTPPDGGWGWVVVFGSFMIHIVTDGMTYSFGIFYNEFLEYFNEGKGYTAWIASIMVGVTFSSGPISSSFVNRYGCRAVTIAGAILASSCIIVSMFAQNVLTLIITIGFGTGLGFGLIYLPAIVSVTQYFEARRSLATGIAVCGSGFGTFVFAPLTEYLIGNYGWRGAMLIIGGIVLNCIIFGAMFRPLELVPPSAQTPPNTPSTPKLGKKSAIIDENTTPAELEPLKILPKDQYLQLPQRTDTPVSGGGPGGALCRSNSVGHNLKPSLNNNSNGAVNGQGPILVTPPQAVVKSTSNDDIARKCHSQLQLTPLRDAHRERSASGTMYRPDALYQGSLHNLPDYVSSRNDLNRSISGSGVIKRYGSLRQSNNVSQSQEETKCCGCITCSKETRDTFAEMMNFSLLKDVIFVIFSVSNFCTSIGFNVPYLYVAAYAETLNISKTEASYLIATIGVANTVGRIILGYISDKPWVNRLLVYNVCLTACGISTAMVPLCHDYQSLAFYCIAFGFTIGAYVGLTSVILVDLLGLDKLTNAFGLLLLFQGIASFIGPPIGGWMYDLTDSYAPAFLMAGLMIAISGVVMFAIPPLQRLQEKKAGQKHHAEHLALS
ncbi:monocarboxylate transporter 12 [Drosophila suzukii]|uniref:Monocarboxylate transporter 12 n=1 Tax=Drosophila suzukii TaxID=28584 RepID=A0AB39ZN29_DROSZ|nr:monocarboxylate transporter 12 [Drosophila suzukii]XP_016939326.1 monocarboxylate transporter 12 [Drosophila suzukii]XP_016939327.1 monocarboxylate transporter 12 [Drosophila suzukii]